MHQQSTAEPLLVDTSIIQVCGNCCYTGYYSVPYVHLSVTDILLDLKDQNSYEPYLFNADIFIIRTNPIPFGSHMEEV